MCKVSDDPAHMMVYIHTRLSVLMAACITTGERLNVSNRATTSSGIQ